MGIVTAVFVGVLGFILGAYWVAVELPERRSGRQVRARLRQRRAPRLAAGFVKVRESFSAVRALDLTLQWADVADPFSRLVARSGVRTNVGTVVLASVFLGVATLAILAIFSSSIPFALAAAIITAAGPAWYLRRAARKRLDTFEEQFPEAMDLIARALRAGHALPTALQIAAEEIDDPVGSEFRLLFDQQNFGMSLPDALKLFADRVPLVDARFFVTAVLTQREMGGNLSEILDRLAAVVRDRFKMKRHVRAVSAHGRVTAVVLGALAPALAVILYIVAPNHIRILVDDPIGINMVAGALILQAIGVVAIRRIVDVEY